MIKKKYVFFFVVLLFTLLTSSILYATDNTTDTTTTHVVNNVDNAITEPIQVSKETQTIDKSTNNTNKEVNQKFDKTVKNIKTEDEITINDYASLKTGIESLEDESEVVFKLNPDNTYTITSPISIYNTVTITINGNGATIEGNGNQWMNGGSTDLSLTIANITVQNCTPSADGGVFSITNGELILENSTFKDCSSPWQGAIINGGNTAVTLTDCTFENNVAGANGGVIFTNNDVTVTNSKFINNQANACGGSIRINGGSLSVENSIFRNNRATQHGGAIYSLTYSTIKNTSFEDNYAEDFYENGGGAIYIDNSEAEISDSEFINNRAENYGGAICSGSDLTITNTSFKRNNAYWGGSVRQYNKNLIINSSSFDENYVNWGDGTGGAAVIFAIADEGSTVLFTLDNSNFTNNYGEPGIRAGAIFVERMNTTVNNSKFNNNTATSNYDSDAESKSSDGGSIYASTTNITVSNSNFTNLEATVNGAGIYLWNAALTVDNSNFENISSDYGGAIYANDPSSISVNNSTFHNISVGTTGGAILSYGLLSVNNSEFIDTHAQISGAIHSHGVTTIDNSKFDNYSSLSSGGAIGVLGSQLTVNNSNFTNNNNNETGIGGAIYTQADTNIDNSIFINNIVSYDGGVIYAPVEQLTVNNSKFINSKAGENGGAIYAKNTTSVDNTEFINCTSNDGGAIKIDEGSLTVNNSKFINNSGKYHGGAIYSFDAVTINNTEFTNNSAEDGGAVASYSQLKVIVDNSNFTDNKADIAGAISAYNELTVNHTTVTNNNAEFYGGAIGFWNGNLTIDESNFINNTIIYHGEGSASNRGALVYADDANVSITNSNITINPEYIEQDKVVTRGVDYDVNITRDNNTINGVFVDEGYVLTQFIMDYPDYLIVGEETTIAGELYDFIYHYYRNDTVILYVDDVEIAQSRVDTKGKFNFTYTQTQAKNSTIKLVLISPEHYYTSITEEKELGYKIQAEIVISSDNEVYESTPITVNGTLTSNNTGISGKQVKIFVNDELMGMAEATDAEGKFTYTFTSNNPEVISIYAELEDENYIANKSNTVNVTNKVATTLVLNQIAQANVNEEITITGTLTYGEETPVEGQKVTVTIGDESFETDATDSEGKFTYTYTPTTPGVVSIAVKFNANDYYLDSNEASMNVTVISGTQLVFDAIDESSDIKLGDENVEINGTLKDANGNGVVGKDIKFTVDDVEVSDAVTTDSEGKFTFVFTPSHIGGNIIAAVFEGDEVYSSSSSNVTVNVKADTQITLDTITSPVNVGDKVTITGKLTDSQGNVLAGQDVSIKVGEATENAQTSGDGTFTVEYETTTIGTVSISAIFDGKDNYLGSSSSSQDLIINTPTKLVVDNITSPVNVGTNVEITGKLTDANDNPVAAQDIVLYINGVAVDAEIKTDDQGVFTYSYLVNSMGINNVSASYAGQDYYLANDTSNVVEFTVESPTVIALDQIANMTVNQQATISGNLKDGEGNPVANQKVTVTIGDESFETDLTDSEGKFTYTYTPTTPGIITVTAKFNANDYYLDSNVASMNVTVISATTLTLDELDEGFFVKVGDGTVELNGTLVDANGNGVADKVIKFTVGEVETTVTTDSEGKFTYVFTPESIGENVITAAFVGDEVYSSSNDDVTVTVKVDTQITLDNIASPVNVGDKVTITGNLTDIQDKAIADQNVTLTIGEETVTVKTNDDGSFSYDYETTTVGVIPISAAFEENGFYLASNSGTPQEVIVNTPTKLVVDNITSPVNVGTNINITGKLTDVNDNPVTGQDIVLYINGVAVNAEIKTDDQGVFTYSYVVSTMGINNVSASYAGQDYYLANDTSNVVEFTVESPTVIALDQIANMTVNQQATISGNLKDGEGNPVANQKVTVTIGDESFETDVTDSEGKFTYTYTPAVPGIISVTAKFNANDYYLDSNVASMNVTVISATTLTLDELDEGFFVKVGDGTVELNGTLVDANGNGVADKVIKFTVGEVETTVATDSEGKFTYVFTPETIGENVITAVFVGDEVYSSSNDDVTVTVKVDTQITLDNVTSPVNVGDKVTITGKLSDSQGNALAGQDVSIKLGESTETTQTSDDGTFTYEYETTNVGILPIAATFEDTGYYLGSNSSQQEVVVVSPTKLVVDEITSPVTIGTNVEITGKLTDMNDNLIAAQYITLYINGEAVNAEITTDDQGIFTYSYMTTANGLYNVTASYDGQDYYLENKTSNVVEFTVKTPTTITVQPITTPVKVNDEITINVELKDSYNDAGLAGQTIIIKVDGEAIASDITDNNDGTYTAKYTVTTAGEHTVTVAFEETDNYFASEDTTGQNIKAIVDTTVVLDAIDTIAHTQVTITVTIVAADDSTVNDGQVTLTLENGTVLATANVENSQATITYIFNEELDTTMTATFNQSDKYADSNATNTVKVVELPVLLTVDTTTFTIGQTTQLKATIYQGSDVAENINKGKVVFKVNGKTIKDENGKVIYAKVVNGVAVIDNFTVPDSWNKENMTISASYLGSTQQSSLNSEKYNITIIQPQPTITTNDITATAGSTISLNATVKAGTEPVNTGKVVFKINGKTVKDENGKVIYAKVVNGTAIIDNYTIPSTYKAKEYTLTATYISADIKIEDIKTLNITA